MVNLIWFHTIDGWTCDNNRLFKTIKNEHQKASAGDHGQGWKDKGELSKQQPRNGELSDLPVSVNNPKKLNLDLGQLHEAESAHQRRVQEGIQYPEQTVESRILPDECAVSEKTHVKQ